MGQAASINSTGSANVLSTSGAWGWDADVVCTAGYAAASVRYRYTVARETPNILAMSLAVMPFSRN